MRVSERRRRTQGGQEIVEFAFVALMFIPLIMGMFSTGMNLIVSIQANNLVRSLAKLTIHGADFSSYPYQQLAQKMSTGLGLQFPSFSGNTASNLGTSGSAIVRISQIMYVGSNTDPNCVAVGAANCNNRNSFVFTQRVSFGSSTVATDHPSCVGDPIGATISNQGTVSNPVTSSFAKLGTSGQAAMASLWQTTLNGQQPLRDGQVLYLAEGFFETPLASVGMFQSGGVYARFFF